MVIRWSSWESLGTPQDAEIGAPFAQRNQDGRLEVFALGHGRVFNTFQVVPDGAWSPEWHDKGRPSASVGIQRHIVGRNLDGRQEIFALGDDAGLWQKWQLAPNDGWSEWQTLGTPSANVSLTRQFTVGRNADGRQEIFAVGSDRNVYQLFQTAPNGGWSSWQTRGSPPPRIRQPDRISVGRNIDGRQQLFVMGADGAVWHVWQTAPNLGWSDWDSLGNPRDKFPVPQDRDLSEPFARENADGHLEVFATGNGAFCNRWQEAPGSLTWRHEGWNAKPKPRETVALTSLDGALNFENRLEVLGFGDDGDLWHAWQIDVAPNWSKWESLGSPSPKIRRADPLSIGTNRDGRLEAFVMGGDGGLWHVWQVR
jgi:hypothetical protein